jgi:hypothetical protein
VTATTEPGAYVRDHYHVPAHLGGRITFTWDGRDATIVGFDDAHLLVQFDGELDTETEPAVLHPTWHIRYHPAEEATR